MSSFPATLTLVFRDQDISPQEQLALGLYLGDGEIERHPQAAQVPIEGGGITLIWKAGRREQTEFTYRHPYPDGSYGWHTDLVHERKHLRNNVADAQRIRPGTLTFTKIRCRRSVVTLFGLQVGHRAVQVGKLITRRRYRALRSLLTSFPQVVGRTERYLPLSARIQGRQRSRWRTQACLARSPSDPDNSRHGTQGRVR